MSLHFPNTQFSYHFRTIEPVLLDQGYINLKNQVIKAERRVLKELGFCVHVKHPHKVILIWFIVSSLHNSCNNGLLA